MNYKSKILSYLQGLLIVFISLSVVSIAHGQPLVSGLNGTVSHSNSVTITGTGFGSKSSAAPVAFGDMENNSVNARIGAWSQTGYPTGALTTSSSYQRNSHSTRNAVCNIVASGAGYSCSFTGGSDSPKWYVQHWFYLGPDFTWGSNGNNKILRLWSTGSNTNNLRVQLPWNHVDIVVEDADVGHGGWGTGWQPVTGANTCADQVFGHACDTNYWGIGPGAIQWEKASDDLPLGTWHLFQWEFQSSGIDTANGVLRWWVDGKQIFDRSDITTRTSSNPSHMRPQVVGIYSSGATDAAGHYYIDDAYIDNTWQRVEIGNNASYNNCSLKEIQPATSWSDGSITFTVNQGSFANGATGYIFITDASGTRNTINPVATVTFGSSGGGTAVNGSCGSSNGQSLSSGPTTNLCTQGTSSSVSGSGPWTWTCSGSNGGTTASCSALLSATAVNGSCGSSHGQSLSSAPTTNLCTLGTASTVSGSGPWTWSCSGTNGGSTNSCSASLLVSTNGGIQRNECASPPSGTVFCEDFEGTSPKSHFDDYDGNPDTENLIVTDSGPANVASNKAVKLWLAANQVGTSDLVKVLPTTYDKLYTRWYFKFEPGFNFNNYNHGGGLTAGDRSYIGQSNYRPAGNDFASFLMQPWSNSGTVPFSYTYYRGMYQNCADPNGSCWGDSLPCVYGSCTKPADLPTVTLPQLTTGQWYCYEQMIDMGTASTDGVTPTPTGRITQWLDGVQFGDNTNLWFRTTSNLKLQNLWLDLFVNNTSHSASGELIDNVVVSTQRIGCGGTGAISQVGNLKATKITP